MRNRRIEILVALFGALGVSGLAFLSLKAANLGSMGGGDTYMVRARFDNIGGLKVRATVRSAGVTVGRVTNIALDNKTFQGVVTMEVERAFHFPRIRQPRFSLPACWVTSTWTWCQAAAMRNSRPATLSHKPNRPWCWKT